MNTDVEDLLREGMERATSDLRAPAGLTHRVARRRMRLALRSGAGVAAMLTAGAVALVVVVVPGVRHDGTGGSVVYTAYVVKRVDSALSAATPAAIAQMIVTTTRSVGSKPVTTTAEEWSYGDQWRSVTYSPTGQPVYDEGFGASSVYTLVNYQARTWARQPGLGRPAVPVLGPQGCEPVAAAPFPLLFLPALPMFQPALAGLGFSFSSPPATVARALRTAISCGTLVVAGRQRVDGIDAIELTSRPGSLIAETVWVSPGTYLPVRVVIRTGPCTPFPRETADITWLPPSAQNLAKLTVPIPAGFRQVPLSSALQLNLNQSPGRPRSVPLASCLPSGTDHVG